MGWNTVRAAPVDALYSGFEREPRFYFDHSYYFVAEDPTHCGGMTHHGVVFAASIRKGPLFGVQFHPEKSHRFGMRLLGNFVAEVRRATEKAPVAAGAL